MDTEELARIDRPYGSWLLGTDDQGNHRLRIRIRWMLAGSLAAANLVGLAVAIVLITWVIPGPDVWVAEFAELNFIAVPVYLGVAWATIVTLGVLTGVRVLRWALADDGNGLTERRRRATLRLPAHLTAIQAIGWAGGLALLTLLYGLRDVEMIPKMISSILLSGTVTCANAFLISEFVLRPIAARALSSGLPSRPSVGVSVRTILFWSIGSAAPVLTAMAVAVSALMRDDVTRHQLIITVLVLGGITLSAGFVLTVLTTRATMAPIDSVRAAQYKVERGNLNAKVIVFDGTELGHLQAGFNDMVAGLRERERVKDLFGKHVGEDVAQVAMASRPELGGEVREVAVLFVDVVGSTRIASTRPPTEVVEVLNRFFAVVVDEVDAHGGFVNKFEGDAALAIFGAPATLADASGDALRAARAMISRLAREVPEFSAGIGVSAGQAVAGYVGAESRLEYTVIGDPVNEAARLTDLAKSIPGHVAAAQHAVERACEAEQGHWRVFKRVRLRGRTEKTLVSVLADTRASRGDRRESRGDRR